MSMSIRRSALVPSFTFATLPTSYAVGQPVWVTNIGRATIGASPVAATGSMWAFNGTVWAPIGGRVLLAKLDVPVTGLTNSEVISGQLLLPAAFFQLKDRIESRFSISKSGTTDTGAARFRIGTAGTVVGDSLVFNGAILAAAGQHGGAIWEHRIETATTTQVLGRTDLGYGGGNSASLPAATTIANISNALYLNVGAVSGGATNTVNLNDAQIWLIR